MVTMLIWEPVVEFFWRVYSGTDMYSETTTELCSVEQRSGIPITSNYEFRSGAKGSALVLVKNNMCITGNTHGTVGQIDYPGALGIRSNPHKDFVRQMTIMDKGLQIMTKGSCSSFWIQNGDTMKGTTRSDPRQGNFVAQTIWKRQKEVAEKNCQPLSGWTNSSSIGRFHRKNSFTPNEERRSTSGLSQPGLVPMVNGAPKLICNKQINVSIRDL